MWILSKSITYHCAQDMEVSTLDSKAFCRLAERWLMWKSKRSQSQTWLRRWKRGGWMTHLSTLMFDPSHTDHFTAWWTSSLAASRANHSVSPASVPALMMKDTCGLPSQEESASAGQQLCFSKTSMELQQPNPQATTQFSTMSSATWKAWVSEQRLDASRRQKSAQHTCASDGSSSLWPTPAAHDSHIGYQDRSSGKKGTQENLETVVRNLIRDGKASPVHSKVLPCGRWLNDPRFSTTLATMNVNLDSAQGMESASKNATIAANQTCSTGMSIPTATRTGLPDPDSNSTNGKNRALLSADWVEQVMGLPPGWTDLGCWGTA